MFGKNKKKLVTHDGSFHADDIFAAATLSIYLEKRGQAYEIIRTRDEEKIKEADYVFDVGGIYDEKINRFDHHQTGGASRRLDEAGIEYASFGLVWKKFGQEICGSQKAFEIIDTKLVAPIDAGDNGINLVDNKYKDVSPYFLQQLFFTMRPTWREGDKNIDEIFFKCVALAQEILHREIIQVRDVILAEEKVISTYQNTADKRIIVLDKKYPFQYIFKNYPEPIFVIYQRDADKLWSVEGVRNDPKTFKNRKDLPISWGGQRDQDLQKITGVAEAIFCHKGLYLVVARTKEGAIKLAQIALES